ncbi:hypothetical protein SEA_SKOG_30 [Gordonia phage Skog]|uniref:Uncharacterized protein n=1 Tax=Gordonia phage Skog TaxID=2704033 RepID=A0A6G6XJA6_9CAUD|nr:hypothetical protein KHQ85_gp030 [Gordonia phage Skog]QIG58182.1 hypothetical protein SEA_SKOG_30 [Gordonia phage Skog]
MYLTTAELNTIAAKAGEYFTKRATQERDNAADWTSKDTLDRFVAVLTSGTAVVQDGTVVVTVTPDVEHNVPIWGEEAGNALDYALDAAFDEDNEIFFELGIGSESHRGFARVLIPA